MAVPYNLPNYDEIWWTKCKAALYKFGSVMTRSKYREITRKFGCPLDMLLVALPQQTRRVSLGQCHKRTRAQTRGIQPVPQVMQGVSAWDRRRGHSPPRRRRGRNAERQVRDNYIAKQRRRRHVSPAHGLRHSHRKGRVRERRAAPTATSAHRTRRARRRREPSLPSFTVVTDASECECVVDEEEEQHCAAMAMMPEPETMADLCRANNGTEEVEDAEQMEEREQETLQQQQQTHPPVFPVQETSSVSQCQQDNRELRALKYEEQPSSHHKRGHSNPGIMRRQWPSPWDIDSNEIIESANITFTCPDITVREGKGRMNSRLHDKAYEMSDLKKIDVILPPIPFQISGAFESLSVESWTVYPVPSDHRGILELDSESGFVDVESLDDAPPLQSSEGTIDPNLRCHEDMNEDYSQGCLPYSVPDEWCDSCREHAVPTSKIFSLAKQCRWPKWVNSILDYMGLNSSGT